MLNISKNTHLLSRNNFESKNGIVQNWSKTLPSKEMGNKATMDKNKCLSDNIYSIATLKCKGYLKLCKILSKII